MIICLESSDNIEQSNLINRLVRYYNHVATRVNTARYEHYPDKIVPVPCELFMEYNIQPEQMAQFKRNYNVHLQALELQNKYKYVIIDRCWLSFSYYNCINKWQEKAIKNLALASYLNLVLYFEGKVELKGDEEKNININDKFKSTKNCVLLPQNEFNDDAFLYAIKIVECYAKISEQIEYGF